MIVLAADLGGTTVKLGLVQGETVLAFDRIPAHADQPMSACLERIGACWEAMLSAAGSKWEDCVAAALAVPFVVAPDNKGVLGDFGKFPGAEHIDFAAWGRARLAGLPTGVIERARQVLTLHEKSEHEVTEELTPKPSRGKAPLQIQLFEPVNYQIADRIRGLDLDELRPLDALKLLAELQEELKRP